MNLKPTLYNGKFQKRIKPMIKQVSNYHIYYSDMYFKCS